jgi:hypothetical protein
MIIASITKFYSVIAPAQVDVQQPIELPQPHRSRLEIERHNQKIVPRTPKRAA